MHLGRILVADDDPVNLTILGTILAGETCELTTVENGEKAWHTLSQNPDRFDVVILDRVMPRMDGLEVLRRMKASPALGHIPVIFQTALCAKEEVAEGIRAGAFYYIPKPLEPEMLLSVVRSASQTALTHKEIQQEVQNFARSLPLLESAEFHYRTPSEAKYLSNLLAGACPEPERAVCGLLELLMNAIEHGNLGLGYERKSDLMDNYAWWEEVERQLALPENLNKQVRVNFDRRNWGILITIQDEGAGFEWEKFMAFDENRVFHAHGRGIAMAKMMSFDGLTYVGNGNTAIATILAPKV